MQFFSQLPRVPVKSDPKCFAPKAEVIKKKNFKMKEVLMRKEKKAGKRKNQ